MLESAGLERVRGVGQLYVKRDEAGRIVLLAVKVTDDLLLAGNRGVLEQFISSVKARFTVRNSIIDDEISFIGGKITPCATAARRSQ